MAQGYGSIEAAAKKVEVGEGGDPPVRTGEDVPTGRWHVAAVAALGLVGVCAFLRANSANLSTVPMLGLKKSDPERQLFYHHQIVDHHDPDSGKYTQRYYESLDYFKGPGSPIFLILGGEDELEKILYPFVSENLAERFGAYTMCVEHRFFGTSQPVKHPTNAELGRLLTPEQAMLDAVKIVQHKQKKFGCSLDRNSHKYCPVISVGASYPGFLSALMRIVYPDVVDIGYASSAPLHLYSHNVDQGAYYEKVTEVAESASPGCKQAVKTALMEGQAKMQTPSQSSVRDFASVMGICLDTLPDYIDSAALLSQEVNMVIANYFAEDNMDFYPPSSERLLVKGCEAFQKENRNWAEKIGSFLAIHGEDDEECFDITSDLPPGPHATISASDWSGVGDGNSGYMWDFLSCIWIPECGMSASSMFPPRPWSQSWMTNYCERRFDWTPDTNELVDQFGFDDLSHVTRLLFTNGINDGWSVASIMNNVSESVLAINMINGAHHSDLTHEGPSERDTEDVKEAFKQIETIIGDWLDDLDGERSSAEHE